MWRAYSYWQRQFSGEPAVVGTQIRLNGHPFTIVGVAQSDFHGATRGFAPELWFPAWAQPILTATWRDCE